MYFALLWSAQNKGKINPCLPQNAGRTEGRVDSLSGHELFFTDITTLLSFSLGLGHFEDALLWNSSTKSGKSHHTRGCKLSFWAQVAMAAHQEGTLKIKFSVWRSIKAIIDRSSRNWQTSHDTSLHDSLYHFFLWQPKQKCENSNYIFEDSGMSPMSKPNFSLKKTRSFDIIRQPCLDRAISLSCCFKNLWKDCLYLNN